MIEKGTDCLDLFSILVSDAIVPNHTSNAPPEKWWSLIVHQQPFCFYCGGYFLAVVQLGSFIATLFVKVSANSLQHISRKVVEVGED